MMLAAITFPSAGDTTAPGISGMMRSGSRKNPQMENVIARLISVSVVSPNKAKTAVINAVANIKGYAALATGKAVWLGGSDLENLSI